MIDKVIPKFDEFLGTKQLSFRGTIIGGAALLILNISTRQTKDVDCIDPKIAEEIINAANEFADKFKDLKIEKNWFNNDPISIKKQLPKGWRNRLQPIYQGQNLWFDTLGRQDLLITKLYAYCDRTDPDYADLLKLKPTKEELFESLTWVKTFDQNSSWPDHVYSIKRGFIWII